jgi:hypothetical protein
MRKMHTRFDQLIFDAGEVLRTKLLRADGTVNWYRIYWRRMWRDLRGQSIPEFTSDLGRQYLLDRFGQFDYATLSKRDKDFVKTVSVLCEFYDTGTIVRSRERIILDGTLGELVKMFVDHLSTLRLKSNTIREREHYLSKFLLYLKEKGVTSVEKVDKFVVMDYLKRLGVCRTWILTYGLLT